MLPANKYITAVINMALIWWRKIENSPINEAVTAIIMHTIAHEIDTFCIPLIINVLQIQKKLYYK